MTTTDRRDERAPGDAAEDGPAHPTPAPPSTRGGRLAVWFDARLGLARAGATTLRKVFPNQWSFLLGEVALYSFVVLVVTGVYLTLFFDASTAPVVYDGPYEPLVGAEVSAAFDSAMAISFEVRAGLLVRQVHHWAALVFVGAIVLHLLRVFFTGAFRRPRELNWVIGVTLLLLSIVNGFAGYSILDDQLSGTGLRIAYSVLASTPLVGTWLASLVFGGEFPGTEVIGRFYALHVLVVPLVIITLLSVHLALVLRQRHTQFPGNGAREDNVVGERLWPTYAFKAASLFFLVAGLLVALGDLAQINPVWLYGPYEPANVSSASQPDWYMGWLDGALRLAPPWETRVAGYTIANPFWFGAVPAGVLFGGMYLWPWIEARLTGDREPHHVLDRPRDRPVRTGFGIAVLVWATVLGFAGSSDVLAVAFDLSVEGVLWGFRVGLVVLPLVAGLVAWSLCRELQRREGRDPGPAFSRRPSRGTARRRRRRG